MLRRISTVFVPVAVLALLFAAAAPAAGHHKAGHDRGPGKASPASQHRGGDHDGDADRDPSTSFTEDNDSDGVPNGIADDGDNRHPSGKDRSVEPGRSGNQGKSESTPDQDGRGPDRDNGGTDKPGGPGGADPSDQDGNNGCGNDDDFDDDNEGLCGGLRLGQQEGGQTAGEARDAAAQPAPRAGEEIAGEVEGAGAQRAPTEVLGEVLVNRGGGGISASVLGGAAGGGVLASTGLDADRLVLLGLLLLALGGALIVWGRPRTSAEEI